MKSYYFIQLPACCHKMFAIGFILLFQFFYPIHSYAGILLVWDASSSEDVSGYKIYYRDETQDDFYNPEKWTTTDTEFPIEEMDEYFTDQTTYYFTVTAYNSYGESDYSNIVDFYYDKSATEDDRPVDRALQKSSSGGGGCFIISIE